MTTAHNLPSTKPRIFSAVALLASIAAFALPTSVSYGATTMPVELKLRYACGSKAGGDELGKSHPQMMRVKTIRAAWLNKRCAAARIVVASSTGVDRG
jgi:hypothetical protein